MKRKSADEPAQSSADPYEEVARDVASKGKAIQFVPYSMAGQDRREVHCHVYRPVDAHPWRLGGTAFTSSSVASMDHRPKTGKGKFEIARRQERANLSMGWGRPKEKIQAKGGKKGSVALIPKGGGAKGKDHEDEVANMAKGAKGKQQGDDDVANMAKGAYGGVAKGKHDEVANMAKGAYGGVAKGKHDEVANMAKGGADGGAKGTEKGGDEVANMAKGGKEKGGEAKGKEKGEEAGMAKRKAEIEWRFGQPGQRT